MELKTAAWNESVTTCEAWSMRSMNSAGPASGSPGFCLSDSETTGMRPWSVTWSRTSEASAPTPPKRYVNTYGSTGVHRPSETTRHSSEGRTNVGSQMTSASIPVHSFISSAPRFSLTETREKLLTPLETARTCSDVRVSSPMLGASAILCWGFAKSKKYQSSL